MASHFGEIEDPRIDRTKDHKLIDIITIAICAVICGAETWVAVQTYGHAKHDWLKQFLELPNGIPSHDTFGRVFGLLNPDKFQECFLNWIKSISKLTQGEVVAIDGKTLRHSYDTGGNQAAIHMVNAWATNNRLVLGQRKVDAKSNEITAIPELLKVLSIEGCIVTIDAAGCQTNIAKQIVEQGGDYVITLKKNQKNLYEQVERLFENAVKTDFKGMTHSYYQRQDDDHGRGEIRQYLMLSNIDDHLDSTGKWSKLKSVGMVTSLRSVNDKITIKTRYYISSRSNNAEIFADAVRSHWSVENCLHWVLDVAFHEDDCRIRKDNAPQNFAVLRQIALNLLNQEKTVKKSIKNKQLLAGWNDEYLAKILSSTINN